MVMPLPESKEAFFDRLRQAEVAGDALVRFHPQYGSYAVCRGAGAWSVRRMETHASDVEAYRAEHATFMPEHAAMLAKPGKLVIEAPTMDALIAALDARWPL